MNKVYAIEIPYDGIVSFYATRESAEASLASDGAATYREYGAFIAEYGVHP